MAETSTIFGFMKYVSATDILSDFKKTVDSHFANSLRAFSREKPFSGILRFWFRNRGIWYVKKLPNCHNLLIMRNDKKGYRNSQYFGFVFSC